MSDDGAPGFLSLPHLLPLQAFGDEAAMFQVYQDGLLMQNTHNLLCLMEQCHHRSSIADEMRVLLQCHCLFVSARGSQQAKEVVSAWLRQWVRVDGATSHQASVPSHTVGLEVCLR